MLEKRILHRVETLTFFARARNKVPHGGPILADDGETMIGSLFIADFPDRAALDEFLANVPYIKVGLYQSVEINGWRPVIYPGPK